MNISFKIARPLLEQIHADLSRPHHIAAERVGFLACGISTLSTGGIALLANTYHPVEDSHYLRSQKVGALINSDAIRAAMEIAMSRRVSIIHIHRHEHRGLPYFSPVDLVGNAQLMPDFWNVSPSLPHGAIVLSHDLMTGQCWYPGNKYPIPIHRYSVIGRPTSSFGVES